MAFSEKKIVSKGLGGFAAVCILSHTQTVELSDEFAPGKSHMLGKGSVHRSVSCFIPSLWFSFQEADPCNSRQTLIPRSREHWQLLMVKAFLSPLQFWEMVVLHQLH